MTSHRLTANEKVTELDTPIASATILPSAHLLGVLLIGPPRLALVPLGGGSAHLIDLHLTSPQEVALLSPDAALVRTADGSVWSLVNLGGEPRPKVVASDIRSLHARPGGAHALGIGGDGSATAFSISRGEISARTFTARGGALRAADVDEHVTYVIAEGEEGGAFRIHPGATPELGTSARTVLPREALDLDRVRGSASLAIVFKRGDAKIAAVTGGPRRFDARLVHLDGKVADVAVIGSSFAAVFLDGRAALYDEATIARAGAGPLAASSQLSLGTRGRPKILLATAIKGASTLCVGTSAGELLSLSVNLAEAPAEKTPEAVEEPPAAIEAEAPAAEPAAAEPEAEPAAAPAAPPPDHTARLAEIEAELDTVRHAFAIVQAAGEQERRAVAEEKTRVLAEVEATREKERLDAADDKARALADLEAAHEAAREKERQAAAEDKARALADLEAAHEAAREKERQAASEDRTRALADLEAAHEAARGKDRQAAAEDKARAIADLEATHEAAREKDRQAAAEDKARAIADLEATHESAREKDRHVAAEDKARAIADLEATHEAAREKDRHVAAEGKARAVADLEATHEAAREKDRHVAAEDKARAIVEAADLAAREFAVTLRSEREEGELALSDCRREREVEMERAMRSLAEEHAAALARAEMSHEQALGARDDAMAALKQRFEEEQQTLSAELETTAKRLGAEIDRAAAVEAELEARTRHLASEHAEVDGLRAEVERLREEAARQKAAVEEQKALVDKLEDAVSRERERAITAERAGEGVINVDRAREKISGVLDRVMTEIQKRR